MCERDARPCRRGQMPHSRRHPLPLLALAPAVLLLMSLVSIVFQVFMEEITAFRFVLQPMVTAYGHSWWRYRPYGVYGNGSNSYAYGGCYYTYTYRRHRRVVVCD